MPFTFPAYAAMAFVGKGHNVMGRSIPTLIPSSRASSIAFCPIRAIEPNATIRYSAFSQSISSKRTSFSSIIRYLAWKRMLFFSISSGRSSSDVMILGLRSLVLPVLAHGHCAITSASVRRGFIGGSTTFSIICPITPSARMIAGLRYLKASSKASPTKSAISCTEAGASAISL